MKFQVSLSDQQLIELYVNGDNQAIEVLIYRYKDKVYSCIYNIIRDKDKADDIFQDIFIKIIDKLKSGNYKHENKFLNWVMRIAYNQCMDIFRMKSPVSHFQESMEEGSFSLSYIPDPCTELAIEKEQKAALIRKMIDRLPSSQREIIILRHYSNLSFKEIAGILGCSLNTALGRMRYGLLNLRKMMDENELAIAF